MSHETDPTLHVREFLYIAAMAFLGDMESRLDDDVKPFNVGGAGHEFVRSERIRDAFTTATGRPMNGEEFALTDRFFMGVVAPTHYNQSLEQYTNGIYDLERPAADAVRDIVFAFTTAWAHRYGGISHCRVVDGVVVSLGER